MWIKDDIKCFHLCLWTGYIFVSHLTLQFPSSFILILHEPRNVIPFGFFGVQEEVFIEVMTVVLLVVICT